MPCDDVKTVNAPNLSCCYFQSAVVRSFGVATESALSGPTSVTAFRTVGAGSMGVTKPTARTPR